MSKTFLTKEGYEKLQHEINNIKNIEIRECIDAMAEASEKGDLSENSEYDAAKEQYDNLVQKLNKLVQMYTNANIISTDNIKCTSVQALTTVCIANKKTKKEVSYKIVPAFEADIKNGKISLDSPMAQSLLGKSKGEIAEFKTPNGDILVFEILDIKL
jgi:transcription elongation factor GreA